MCNNAGRHPSWNDYPPPDNLPSLVIKDPSLPLVSIVTPSYNQGKFIRETIESVLNQDYPNIEYWVIDGGSTDETLSILQEYDHDPRFHWISEKDAGQSDAINKGWSRCRGEILHYLNSDDWLEEGAIRRVIVRFQQSPEASFVSGSCNHTDEGGRTQKVLKSSPIKFEHLIFDNYIWQQATFFRRCVLEHIGYLDTRFHFVMDYEYWVRAIAQGKTFAHVSGPPLANFRRWSGTKSGGESQYKKYSIDRQNMARKFFGNNLQDYYSRIAWAGAYYATAWFEYAMGNAFQALKNFGFSVYLVPKAFFVTRWFDYLFMLGKILLWTQIRFARVKRLQATAD